MPYIDKYRGIHLEAAEAAAKGYCPECGRPLSETSYEVETMLHWPHGDEVHPDQVEPEKHRAEIKRRKRLIYDYYNPPAPLTPELVKARLEKAKQDVADAEAYLAEHPLVPAAAAQEA